MSFNCKLRFGIKKQPHRGFLSNSPGAEGNAVWLFVWLFFFSGQHDLFRRNYLALLRKHKPLVRAAELVIKCMISPSLLTQVLQQPMSSEKNKCGRTSVTNTAFGHSCGLKTPPAQTKLLHLWIKTRPKHMTGRSPAWFGMAAFITWESLSNNGCDILSYSTPLSCLVIAWGTWATEPDGNIRDRSQNKTEKKQNSCLDVGQDSDGTTLWAFVWVWWRGEGVRRGEGWAGGLEEWWALGR